jgi:MFS family permease
VGEWQRGWKIVLGAAIGSGLGIPLFYYVFSLFSNDMIKEFGMSRGEFSNVQALIVVGALVAPVIGRILDRRGFALVFSFCTLTVAVGHLAMAGLVSSITHFALIAFLYGAAGVGCGPLAYTRPVNAWFWEQRGLALGIVALGLALTAAVTPPLLATLIAEEGWRSGFVALAIVSAVVGLPLTLWLVKESPPEGPAGPQDAKPTSDNDKSHFGDINFWLMCGAMLCMAIPGSGLISQLSPMVQEEGLSPQIAAFGITGYAIGQVLGRIVAGYFLDRTNPRVVGFVFTFFPAAGFLMLGLFDLSPWLAVFAVLLVGVQQGAEIDLFAWFTARRFGLSRYGTVYGWIIAIGWIGNAAGIVAFGWMHDYAGSYVVAELMGAGLLALAAVMIAAVKTEPDDATASSHSSPGHLPAA